MQQLEPDDNDWDDGCRNDAVDIMETEEPERIVIPMQPTTLEAVRVDIVGFSI